RLVARNGLPRIIGTSVSSSMSMITKSTGNTRSLIVKLGCRID
ncbi:hypothetical protein A2U01_0102056, partial [Trifolium medium]|nr:hypothetical protein [Trifolium medium]